MISKTPLKPVRLGLSGLTQALENSRLALRCFACALLAWGITTSAWAEEPILGQSSEYSAGPYSFQASPISFRGQSLGHAEASFKLKRFFKYRAFQSCVLSRDEPGTGGCRDWKILDSESGQLTNLRLPHFDAFWSAPAFSWPYIAYVKRGKVYKEPWEQDIHCVVFNFHTNRVVRQNTRRIDAGHFETDVPGLFPSPLVAQIRGTAQFEFFLASGGNSESLCKISLLDASSAGHTSLKSDIQPDIRGGTPQKRGASQLAR